MCYIDSEPSSSEIFSRLNQQNVFQKNGFKCTLVKQLIAMVSFESKPLVFLAQLMYIVTAIKEYEDTYIFIYKTGTYFVIIFKWAFWSIAQGSKI